MRPKEATKAPRLVGKPENYAYGTNTFINTSEAKIDNGNKRFYIGGGLAGTAIVLISAWLYFRTGELLTITDPEALTVELPNDFRVGNIIPDHQSQELQYGVSYNENDDIVAIEAEKRRLENFENSLSRNSSIIDESQTRMSNTNTSESISWRHQIEDAEDFKEAKKYFQEGLEKDLKPTIRIMAAYLNSAETVAQSIEAAESNMKYGFVINSGELNDISKKAESLEKIEELYEWSESKGIKPNSHSMNIAVGKAKTLAMGMNVVESFGERGINPTDTTTAKLAKLGKTPDDIIEVLDWSVRNGIEINDSAKKSLIHSVGSAKEADLAVDWLAKNDIDLSEKQMDVLIKNAEEIPQEIKEWVVEMRMVQDFEEKIQIFQTGLRKGLNPSFYVLKDLLFSAPTVSDGIEMAELGVKHGVELTQKTVGIIISKTDVTLEKLTTLEWALNKYGVAPDIVSITDVVYSMDTFAKSFELFQTIPKNQIDGHLVSAAMKHADTFAQMEMVMNASPKDALDDVHYGRYMASTESLTQAKKVADITPEESRDSLFYRNYLKRAESSEEVMEIFNEIPDSKKELSTYQHALHKTSSTYNAQALMHEMPEEFKTSRTWFEYMRTTQTPQQLINAFNEIPKELLDERHYGYYVNAAQSWEHTLERLRIVPREMIIQDNYFYNILLNKADTFAQLDRTLNEIPMSNFNYISVDTIYKKLLEFRVNGSLDIDLFRRVENIVQVNGLEKDIATDAMALLQRSIVFMYMDGYEKEGIQLLFQTVGMEMTEGEMYRVITTAFTFLPENHILLEELQKSEIIPEGMIERAKKDQYKFWDVHKKWSAADMLERQNKFSTAYHVYEGVTPAPINKEAARDIDIPAYHRP